MALVEELGAAVGSLTVFRRVAAGTRRESQAAGLAFYPIVGLALGTLAAAAAWLLSSGAVGVLVLLALGGGRAPYALAAAADAALRAGGRAEARARLAATPGGAGGWGAVARMAALTTLGVRILVHRRVGGLTGRVLSATRELVETVVLATLGLLARLMG